MAFSRGSSTPFADKVLLRLGRAPLPISLPGRRVFEFLALYAIDTLIAGLGLYCLTQSVYPAGTDDMPTIVGSYAVANTFSILAFILPGGLGAREAGMAVALSPVMPTAPAVAVAVLSRVLQLGLEVILALVTPLLARRRDPRPAPRPRRTASSLCRSRATGPTRSPEALDGACAGPPPAASPPRSPISSRARATSR